MTALDLPDTPLVREARAILDAAAAAPIRSHSVRTFLYGRAYGRRQQLDVDEEGFACAALFHDLGLCAGHRSWLPFPRVGARALECFLRERGVAAARITPMCEAIECHNQLFPRWSKGHAAGLLQVGAWMDVMGRNRQAIADEAAAIRAAHPPEKLDWSCVSALLPAVLNPATAIGVYLPRLFG